MTFTRADIEDLRCEIEAFANARDWGQFHTPRNLLLAVQSELGEVADIVRWQGDADPTIPADRKQDWDDEIADTMILLLRLADRSGVDLTTAIRHKLLKAGEKYPVEGFRGSPRKYDQPENRG